MNRIEKRLEELKKENKKAFITYMTAGLPSLEETKAIIKEQEKAGIDIIELGIPFSDPIADGPVIQAASYKSIQLGTNLKKVFKLVEELRADCEVPIVFMLYYNTVLYYGVQNFIDTCAKVGVDGMIIPDLPYEETFEIKECMAKNENSPLLIPLVAPVSKDRIEKIVKDARGFVYCVSSMGVTGQAADFHKNVSDYLKEVKEKSPIPIMMGFGIRTAKDVEPFRDTIDGCIVGSHFIRLMEENNYDKSVISDYVKTFKSELN
jgi:tryptophan synthase alpha chain